MSFNVISDASVLGLFWNLRPMEIFIFVVIFLLLFGSKKLPDVARGVGKSIREFKKSFSGVEQEFKEAIDSEPKAAPKAEATAATPETPEKPQA